MTETSRCPRCGSELPIDAPEGLCPRCLVRVALEDDTATAEDEVSPPAPGRRIRYLGDYELLEEIGRGGMGVIYKARQVSLGRTVAVKLVLGGDLASERERERFRREARALAALRHPNIVTIHEVGEFEGQPYFSMDYVEGRNLAELLTGGPLHPVAAAGLVRTVAEAVHFAHREGTLHRDLKPSNILIDETGQPRITDFGLAKRLDSEAPLTGSGEMVGTPGYMPPEQIGGRRARPGPPSDVYALGAILYELVTGRPPFAGANSMDAALRALREEPESPRVRNPELDRDVETLCLKCLEKDPARRYPTARDLADDLGRYLRREPLAARPVSRPARVWRWCRRNPWPTVTGVALLLLAGLAASFAVSTRERLWLALVDQARMERLAGRRGRSLERLAEASRLKRNAALREEALHTLITPGVALVRRFPVGAVEHLALSSDARLLAVGGTYGSLNPTWEWREEVRVWDVEDGSFLGAFQADNSHFHGRPSFTFLPGSPVVLFSRTAFDEAMPEPPRPRSTVIRADREEAVLWDPATGRELESIALAEPHAGSFEFKDWIVSPGGNLAARRDLAFLLEIWDLAGRRVDAVLEVADPLAFLSERQLLLYERDGLVLWDVETSRPTKLTPRPLAWSDDGRVVLLAEGSGAGVVRLPERETVRRLPLEGHQPWPPESARSRLLLSPHGRRLAVRDDPGTSDAAAVTLWDAADGDPNASRPISRIVLGSGHRLLFHKTAFNPGGTFLAATGGLGDDGYVKVWDVETGAEVAHLAEHQSPLWSADGRVLLTVGPGAVPGTAGGGTSRISNEGIRAGSSTAYVWRVASPPSYALSRDVGVLEFRGDGTELATNDRFWDVERFPDSLRLRRSASQPRAHWVHFDGRGRAWALEHVSTELGQVNFVVRLRGSGEGPLVEREVSLEHPRPEGLEPPKDDAVPRLFVDATDVSPDGRLVAVAGRYSVHPAGSIEITTLGHFLDVWDLAADPPERAWFETSSARSLLLMRFATPDGILTREPEAEPSALVLRDNTTGRRIRSFELGGRLSALAVSADRERLYLALSAGTLEVLELSSGRRLASWESPGGGVRALAVSADGRLAATGDEDRTIRLWETATGRELVRWPAHAGPVTRLAFDPRSTALASGGADGRVRLWHLPSLRRALADLGLDWEGP